MRKLITLLTFTAALLTAQTAETVFFRAIMLPSNEVPVVTGVEARGAATMRAHVVRDAAGKVASGSVDFQINYNFTGETVFQGLHIHRGTADVAGGVVIDTGLSATNTITSTPSGVGLVDRQAQVLPTNALALSALTDLLDNPAGFYVNIHTPQFPGGVMRGQLIKAEVVVLMGQMSTKNEVDPPAGLADLTASGVVSITALRTRDDSGAVNTGQVIFEANYTFPGQQTFTGFHIHSGPAGVNAAVTISTGIGGGTASVQTPESGVGGLVYPVEIPMTNQPAVDALNGLYVNPANYYANIHTVVFTGGAIRAQLRNTDTMSFPVTMLTSNETPPITGLDAQGIARVTINTLRNPDGSVAAGRAVFDVNHRFPDAAEFTGLHIHDGLIAVAGGVTVDSGLSGTNTITSPIGFGNVYRTVNAATPAALATINSLVANPERHYVNLHTRVNPGGAVRAQLIAPSTVLPAVTGVSSAAANVNAAMAGLVSIYGTNLVKVPDDLSGLSGDTIPAALNGVKVTIGGKEAPLIYISRAQINAQVPVDAGTGTQPVVVTNGNGASTSFNATIAANAPAIFFYSGGGIVVKNNDFSLITPANPAASGDTLLIYATGLGQTTPGMSTGKLVQFPPRSDTAPVTVTVGGANATVVSSIASPSAVGLYQVAITMPGGVAAGMAPVVLRMGTIASNSVNIAVK